MTPAPSHVRLAVLAAAVFATPGAFGFPVVSSTPETIRLDRTSIYRQGYSDSAGTLYTGITFKRADGTWGTPGELRQNLADIKPLLAADTARLVDYYEFATKPVYVGDGEDLTPATTSYGWKGQYGIAFTGTSVLVEVGISLDWTGVTDPVDPIAQQLLWEQRIEGWWDDRYRIVKDEQYFFPIDFDIIFGGRDNGHGETIVDHSVRVMNDGGRDNAAEWYLASDAQTNAHEFGHLLGLFDEYWTGGLNATGLDVTDPLIVPTDYGHLMGASQRFAFGGGMKSDYYVDFMTWLDGVDPDATQTYRLAMIPEPGTIALVALALLAARGRRGVRRRESAAA